MTVQEVAARLGTSIRVVQDMCKRGVLGAVPPRDWDVCPLCLEEYVLRPRGKGRRQPKQVCSHRKET